MIMDIGQNEQLRVHCDSFDFDTIDSFLVIESFLAIVSLDLCVMIWILGKTSGYACIAIRSISTQSIHFW